MSKQQSISAKEYREMAAKSGKKLKYRNQITKVDGIKFSSKKEAVYHGKNILRVKIGELVRFERQVPFVMEVNGNKVAKYVADFVEYYPDGSVKVIDVKSSFTRKLALYQLKKRLMKEILGIEIIEK